jgi:hypothetical protein
LYFENTMTRFDGSRSNKSFKYFTIAFSLLV